MLKKIFIFLYFLFGVNFTESFYYGRLLKRTSNLCSRNYNSRNFNRQISLLKKLLQFENKEELEQKIKILKEQASIKVSNNGPNILFSPWRTEYTKAAFQKSSSPKIKITEDSCPFCLKFNQTIDHDRENLILKRYKHCAVKLNLYPYCIGHMMVLPYKHFCSLDQLNSEEMLELMDVISTCVSIANKALKNDACNVGINLGGGPAGGSIPDHFHFHIVPRFNGDTSFLTVLANTQIIAAEPMAIYDHLKNYFEN